MQTLVLGTPASQEPLESFFQRLGNEAVEIVDRDGEVRAQVIPVRTDVSESQIPNGDNWVDPRIMAEITKDIDNLKRLALQPRSTLTTEELLRSLNSLPLPE